MMKGPEHRVIVVPNDNINFKKYKILFKRTDEPGYIPTPEQLDVGEIGFNTYDGILFFKNEKNEILMIKGTEVSSRELSEWPKEIREDLDVGQVESVEDNLVVRGIKKLWKFLGKKI